MKIKWFPRSWIQLKSSSGYVIYIDPSYMSTYFKNYNNKIIFSEEEDDVLPEELEKGNLILISHIHKDHCKEVTIKRLSHRNTIVLTPKKYNKELDKNAMVVKSGDKYQFENILIEVVHAYNISEGNSKKKVHKKEECAGYIINVDNKRVYFSGDTDLISEMKDISNIDIAIIPIGGIFTMDMDEAEEAMLNMKPKIVIPVHHLKQSPFDYKHRMEKLNIDVVVPVIGEEIIFN
ncbi:MAG: MBL fold metallo-hydrolase [Mobilitalea sp.]